ncbi:MAG TPA: aspartate kinase [Thermoanaerobacterales bacterium]|nr:aspartate kinase [Thermoanaerobacterales bacterium]
MAIIVQKFGGTSVKSPESRKAALKHIMKAKEEGFDVVVVVSAMGRKGDPYATDTLIQLLESQGGSVCPKKKDLIMACGEIISSAVMAAYIESAGFPAEAMTGFQAGILTTRDFGCADIINIDPEPIMEKLKEGKVVVVAGFQGQTEKGEITTLGRGGSDTTAVMLGGYLKADVVDIYTDVPGVAVTDPRIIPEAPFLSRISFKEMLVMAESGAKVIHPRAVKAAMNFNMPFRIKSTFDDGEGTLVGQMGNEFPISGISLQENVLEGYSEVTVVYNECDAAVNAHAISRKIKSLLNGSNIPIGTCRTLSDCFYATIPKGYAESAVRVIFNGFFREEAREAG